MANFSLTPWLLNPATSRFESNYVAPPINKTITVTATGGQNFGGGPSVVLFDQFIGNNFQPAFRTPDVGYWDNITTYVAGIPKLYFDPATNRTWLSGRDPQNFGQNSWNMAGLFKKFGNTTQFRFSQRTYVPVGKLFPGAASAGVFPAVSSWKMSWFGKTAAGDADLVGTGAPYRNVCIPSHTGNGAIYVGGNTNAPIWWDGSQNRTITSGFSLTAPTMYSYYQDGAGTYDQFDRTAEILYANDNSGGVTVRTTTDPFHGDGGDGAFTTRDYDGVRIPGWFGNQATWVDVVPLYNDVYIATGVNSRAAVYVSNSPTVSGPSNMHILYPEIWNTGTVQAVLKDHNDFGASTYIHIELADGTWLENVAFTRS